MVTVGNSASARCSSQSPASQFSSAGRRGAVGARATPWFTSRSLSRRAFFHVPHGDVWLRQPYSLSSLDRRESSRAVHFCGSLRCATITCNVLDPWPFFVTAPAACFCTAFLRANRLISFWSLVLSLILGEWFTAAAIVYSCGYETLFQLLGFQNSDAFFRELALHQCFPKRFPGQLWYIGAPWLLGIVVGEIMAQRRKPSGGERQRV